MQLRVTQARRNKREIILSVACINNNNLFRLKYLMQYPKMIERNMVVKQKGNKNAGN